MTHEALTTFFGWATLLNFGFLTFAAVILMVQRERLTRLHAGMFGLQEKDVSRLYFQWLAQFKIMAIVTSFVPWLALTIM